MRFLLFLLLLLGFSRPSRADSETYKNDVSAESYSNYILSGTDRNGSVTGNNSTVNLHKGDTIIFDINESINPYI